MLHPNQGRGVRCVRSARRHVCLQVAVCVPRSKASTNKTRSSTAHSTTRTATCHLTPHCHRREPTHRGLALKYPIRPPVAVDRGGMHCIPRALRSLQTGTMRWISLAHSPPHARTASPASVSHQSSLPPELLSQLLSPLVHQWPTASESDDRASR